mgnify:CR=1 FL=1
MLQSALVTFSVFAPLDDLPGDLEAHIRVFADPGVVVGYRHHRHIVFLDQRQDRFQPLIFAGDRIQQWPPLHDFQPARQRPRHRAVDAQRHVDQTLHQFHDFTHQGRLGLVRVGVGIVDDASVDIQNHGPAGDLLKRVPLDG